MKKLIDKQALIDYINKSEQEAYEKFCKSTHNSEEEKYWKIVYTERHHLLYRIIEEPLEAFIIKEEGDFSVYIRSDSYLPISNVEVNGFYPVDG